MKLHKLILYYTLIGVFFTSCIKDLDFDQAKEIELSLVSKVALAYFKINENDFIDPNTNLDTPIRLDFTDINAFDTDIVKDKTEKAILKFEIENTFNKEFLLDFYLVDVDNNTLEIIPFTITENSILIKNIEYLKGTISFENLLKTERIFIVTNKITNTNTTNSDMFLHFKSAVDLYLKINNE